MGITNKALTKRFITGTDANWEHSSYSVFKTRYGVLSLIVHSEDYDRGGWIYWESIYGDSLQDLCNQIRDAWFSVDALDRAQAASYTGLTLKRADQSMADATDPTMIADLLNNCGSGYLFDPYVVRYASTDREFLLSVTGYDN